MDKNIGYQVIIDPVHGFSDAKMWIYRMIRAGIVKCGQCDQAATNIFWQDAAEWYCRCEDHREQGDMWTGSTRWNPSSFGINVIQAEALGWLETLEADEREKVTLEQFDATNYWSLIERDESICHYLKGSAEEDGAKLYVNIYPLKTGEYAYTISSAWLHGGSGTCYTGAITGAWPTESEALEAARVEALSPRDPDADESNS
jgi:hypothetical protein